VTNVQNETKSKVLAALSLAVMVLTIPVSILSWQYQPGPAHLWTTDACPAQDAVCGQPALGPMFVGLPLIALAGALLYVARFRYMEVSNVQLPD